jgi:tetratricopeptide (TPR) repeat protein
MPEKSTATSPRIGDLTKRLQREPGSRVFYELAREHHAAGNLEDAAKLCREGLQRHPAYHAARVLLGKVLIDLKQYAGARPELEQVVKHAPDNLLARKLLAEALLGDHDPRAALSSLRTLVLLHPEDQESVQRIQDLESQASRREAEGMETLPASIAAPDAHVPGPPRAEEATTAFRYEPPPPAEAYDEVRALASTPESEVQVQQGISRSADPPERREEDRREEASASTVLMPMSALAAPELSPTTVMMPVPQFPLEEELTAPSSASPPAAREEDEPTLGALPTPTLAEIYLAQGMADRALEIYRQVLTGDPHNQEALARVRELSGSRSPSGSLTQRKIQVLEGWLERIRRHRDVQDDA